MLRILTLSLVGFLLLGIVDDVQADSIRIGVLTDLSGPMASWGNQARLGAQIAADEIKQSGADFDIVLGDHQLQGKNAVSELRKLTDIDKIDALYCEFTPAAVAIAPIIEAKNLPMIYSAAATSPLKSASRIFKTYTDYREGCHMIATAWKAKGIKKVGLLKANLEFGELCLEGAKQVFPNLEELVYNPGDEVNSQLLIFKSHAVEGIINAAFTPDYVRMFKSLERIRYFPLIGATNDAVGETVHNESPNVRSKILAFGQPEPSSEFITNVKAHDPKNTLQDIEAAGMSYLHVHQLFEATKVCKQHDTNCVFEHISQSPKNETIGFQGWNNRIAVFKLNLMAWDAKANRMHKVN